MRRFLVLAALWLLSIAAPVLATQYRDTTDLSVISPGAVIELAPSRGGAPQPASSTNPVPATPFDNFDTGAIVSLSAAGAGTTNSADQTNIAGNGAKCVVDITVAGGTPTLTVTIQGKDTASGKYYTILTSAALASVSTTVLTVFPAAPVTANVSANDEIPHVWRLSAVVGGTTPAVTATAGCSVIE